MGCDDDSHHISQSPQLLQPSSPPPSSSSSESSFRELEDAFLQTQTRIWLGEVLQIRLDENLIISELLSDGELLFQVSKVVWRLLLTKHMELRHKIAYQHQPFASKKNSGRYRPYSNVDSFLKICKILGLTGIDLFSPSDVVEKRNTRKVCMCIRSLSNKARSKHVKVPVPDFDVVSCTITMPKDMVGGIRRNLELSQSSFADSPTYYYLQKQAEAKHRQGYSVAASPRDHETYLEEYDTTELQSEAEFEFLSSEKSLDPCSESVEHDCNVAWTSTPRSDNSHLDTRKKHAQESGFMGFDYSDQSLSGRRDSLEQVATSNLEENSTSNVHHSASSHGSNTTPGSIEYDKEYFDISDDNMEVLRNRSMEPVNLNNKFDAQDNFETLGSFEIHNDKTDRWNKIIEGYTSQDAMAYEITSNAKYLHSKFEDNNNSLDSNASFHESEDLLSFRSCLSSEFCKWDQKGKGAFISPIDRRIFSSSFPKVGSCQDNTSARHKAFEAIPSKPNEEEAAVKLDIDDKQTNKDCQVFLSNVEGMDCHVKCPSNEEDSNDHDDIGERVLYVVTNEEVSRTRSCLTDECSKLEYKNGDQEYQYDMDPACRSEYTIETHLPEEITPEDEKASPSADNLDKKKEARIETPRGKPQNNLILKSVLGGTAAVGMLVMFLHLRRSAGGKDPASIKTSSGDTAKDKVQKYPSQKTQGRSRTEGVYPAEKLKLSG